ncbi:MAG: ligase-associated DNA damage response DEXH box helicase [Gemmatimonadales bacterium]|nr:MAG: ligase-associated DNA damage response DEXH box helicase [Gemmatimonadales bacterium]
MARRGWEPFVFQEACWEAWRSGADGVLHAPTGVGKTLAVWGGAVLASLDAEPEMLLRPADGDGGSAPLRHLWITPLRALARTTLEQATEVVEALGLPWSVELRSGDTPSARKARQLQRLPTVLITTPESLSVLLSRREGARQLRGIRGVVVDEWHELLGTKRGVQTELGLARLRRWNPDMQSWGLSATLSNVDEALDVLCGSGPRPRTILRADAPLAPPARVRTLIPPSMGRFPWSGHLGLQLLDQVLPLLDQGGTTLLFTNTRSQAELWYDALQRARPELGAELALHHGSLGREIREEVEEGLRRGSLTCVVCTSSLDLGVDFPAVDRVVQVGSPKGVGRLLQRAGRSGHGPGRQSHLVAVPTHAFEMAEFAAAREAMGQEKVEPRRPLQAPLDVLAQHLVTVALGGGFRPADLLAEVRTTWAYRTLKDGEWRWVMDFVTRGGSALKAYPQYRRVVEGDDGVFRVPDLRTGRRHRMAIGTITSDAALTVRYLKGRTLGTIEESFLSRLRPGETFLFAGRRLKLVRVREMTAWVRRSRGGKGAVPRWMGGRMPLSTELGERMLEVLPRWGERLGSSRPHVPATLESPLDPEETALEELLALQQRWSRIPSPHFLLVERTRTREGHHLFVYPFLGRLAHEGLAALLAWRLTRQKPRSVEFSVNDYGFELLSSDLLEVADWGELLSPEGVAEELLQCLNAAELARRQFREIARIAGLVFPGYPGKGKSTRQVQASSGLIFDVLQRYDPENLFLDQARREVMERELNIGRIRDGLIRLHRLPVEVRETERLTPLAFPLWADRLHASVSSEAWIDRVRRMAGQLEKAAGT